MQIVIEISDTLKNIADNEDAKTFSHIIWQALLMDAIKNGQPLPKGHGRLIDAEKLLDTFWTYCKQGDFGYHQAKDLIKSAQPIIEADRGDVE